jgi:hypothetical protein
MPTGVGVCGALQMPAAPVTRNSPMLFECHVFLPGLPCTQLTAEQDA